MRFGTLEATVVRVSHDAIPDSEAQALEGNPASAGKSTGYAGAQRMQNLVFPITLVPSATTIFADQQKVSITPGMAVTAEVRTGSRRILEYVFSPLVETTSRAMRSDKGLERPASSRGRNSECSNEAA